MILHLLDYPNYAAFRRLIMIKLRKDPDLMTHRMHELLYLGSEHGICRDDAYQIMDICLEEAKLAA